MFDSLNDSINQIVDFGMAFFGSIWFWILAGFIVFYLIYKKVTNRGG